MGLGVQLCESKPISNQTPLDQYLRGNNAALTAEQQLGLDIFKDKGKCINCHGGTTLTNASVKNFQGERLELMVMGDGDMGTYDNGFYNIGVRPTKEDLGLGFKDPFGNPLSETRVAQQGKFQQLLGATPNESPPFDRIVADGAFKTSSLRNVELTAPYFHNGGQLTLRQVVDFYNRGWDRRGPNGNDTTGFPPNGSNLDADIQYLGLTEAEKGYQVAFLSKGLTDPRVRPQKAPFRPSPVVYYQWTSRKHHSRYPRRYRKSRGCLPGDPGCG